MTDVDLSIVIPVLNESEALPRLIEEIVDVCDQLDLAWEAIVVDDGSSDGTFNIVEQLAAQCSQVRGIRLRRNFGKSAALATGFEYSRGEVIVTIDGDGQDDPADIPALLESLAQGADLVSGWKRERQDPPSRRFASRVFNFFARRLTGVEMHDMNCGLKGYRAECARALDVYGELHRFLPALAVQQGWRVGEIPVNHRPRLHGRSRFGAERYLRGALDLLTVVFIGRYRYRPLHLFGGIGLGLTAIGTVLAVYLAAVKLTGEAIGQRPLLIFAVLFIVVGLQLLTFGLLAQMIVLDSRSRRDSRLSPSQIEWTVGDVARPEPFNVDSRRSATGTNPRRSPR